MLERVSVGIVKKKSENLACYMIYTDTGSFSSLPTLILTIACLPYVGDN